MNDFSGACNMLPMNSKSDS